MDIKENHKEHVLKTDHVVFQDVLDGNKTFEIRFNDRDYQVGDLVILKETEFTGEQMKSGQPLVYTGREIQKRISYVLSGYGLHEGWVILGIQDIKVIKAQAVPEPSIDLTGHDIKYITNFMCYEDQDNLDTEVTIQKCKSGFEGAGLYAWVAEYPGEGGIKLSESPQEQTQ